MNTYDVIIIGGGLLGTSTAATLSLSGKKILLLDAHKPHNSKGSSHGHARITRRANYESPIFNKTAADSLAVMRAMDMMAEKKGDIVRDMEGIYIVRKGSPAHKVVTDSADASQRWHETIEVAQARAFGFCLERDQIGIIDMGAAVFNPAKVLDVLYGDIARYKGSLRFETPVTSWQSTRGGVTVETADERFKAHQLVIAAGAWTPNVLGIGNGDQHVVADLTRAMKLERVPLFFFDYPKDVPDTIMMLMDENGRGDIYGMPEIGEQGQKLLKIGFHHGHPIQSPDENWDIAEKEKQLAITFVEKLYGRPMVLRKTDVCLYAQASDQDLPVVGPLPRSPNIYLNAYGGGVCAKHAIALGNALGDVMQGKPSTYDLSAFSAERFIEARPGALRIRPTIDP